MAAHRVVFPIGLHRFAVFITFVAGDTDRGPDTVGLSARFEHMDGAHDVGRVGLDGMIVRVPDQRLSGEVEDDFRLHFGDQSRSARLVANIDDLVPNEFGQPGLFEETRVGRRIERETRYFGAHVLEPEAQPSAFETRVAGDEDALAGPGAGVHQHFHGAPCCHNSSRWRRSRSVSIGCQKPSWR